MSKFTFKGGKTETRALRADGGARTYSVNFYVFLVVDGKEIILYEATRKGYISKHEPGVRIETLTPENVGALYADTYRVSNAIPNPHLKVFTSISGFGVQKQYVSKYIRLGGESLANTTIFNIPIADKGPVFGFHTQGDILTNQEVGVLLQGSAQAMTFYNAQAGLGVTTMRNMIATGVSKTVMKQRRIRRIRL